MRQGVRVGGAEQEAAVGWQAQRPGLLRLLHLRGSLQSARSCGRAFVSELSEEAQSKRRRLADRLSALIR